MAGEEALYALTASQVVRLKNLLEMVEGGGMPNLPQGTKRPPVASRVLVGILTDAVAATTALTSKPKVGTLNVYSFTSTGTVDTGVDETCYNFAPQSATTDRWTVCERCSWTGKLVITTQFCS